MIRCVDLVEFKIEVVKIFAIVTALSSNLMKIYYRNIF